MNASPKLHPRLVQGLGIAALLSVVGVFLLYSLRVIADTDFFWQLSTGRLVLDQGIPHKDVFTYPRAGTEWIELRWLFFALVATIERIGGYPALVLFKTVVLASAFWVSVQASGGLRRVNWIAPVLLLALVASSQRFGMRPEAATYLMVALFVAIGAGFAERGGKWIWAIPILQALWANCHTLFMIGPGIVLALVVDQAWHVWRADADTQPAAKARLKIAAIVFGLTALACFLTPYGWRGIEFTFQLLTQIRGTIFKDYITELRGTFAYLGSDAVNAFVGLVALTGFALVANLRALRPFWVIVLLAMGFLAWSSIRNLPLFTLIAIPFVVQQLATSPLKKFIPETVNPYLKPGVAIGTIGASALLALPLWNNRMLNRHGGERVLGLGLSKRINPVDIGAHLKQFPLKGRVYNTLGTGSWLTTQGIKVFVDPRLEVQGQAHFSLAMDAANVASAFKKTTDDFGITAAIVEVNSGEPFFLSQDPGWKLATFDEVAALFVRGEDAKNRPVLDGKAAVEARLAELKQQIGEPKDYTNLGPLDPMDTPGVYSGLASFMARMRYEDLAVPWAKMALKAWPFATSAHYIIGQAALKAGDREAAAKEFRAELENNPDDPPTLGAIGINLFFQGKQTEALPFLEKSVKAMPANATAWLTLMGIYYAQGDLEKAQNAGEQALVYAPDNLDALVNLSGLYVQRGYNGKANDLIARAVKLDPNNPNVIGAVVTSKFVANDFAGARREIERGLRLHPNDANLKQLQQAIQQAERQKPPN